MGEVDLELKEALAALGQAVDERDSAARVLQARVETAAAAVEDKLRAAGEERDRTGSRLEREVARSIYWDMPDVHVNAIAAAVGVRTGEVHEFVGEAETEYPCPGGCGRTLSYTATSRAGVRSRKMLRRQRCDECREKQDLQWQRRQNTHDLQDEYAEERMRAALEAGVELRPTAAEFEGLPGTWILDENGRPTRPI